MVATAFATIDRVTGTAFNYKKKLLDPVWELDRSPACGVGRYLRLRHPAYADRRSCQIFGFLSLDQVLRHTNGPKQKNKFNIACACIRASSWSLVHRLISFKMFSFSVLAFVGSVCEPDKETVTGGNLALQSLPAGPLHAPLAALQRRRSSCGLKTDADGTQPMSKAARFRVACHSAQLSPGRDRIRAAKDHCDLILDSFTVTADPRRQGPLCPDP